MISYAQRTIVNGSLLRDHLNKNVSIHVNVEPEAERNAKVINAKTTDDLDVQIVLNEPLNTPVKGWMEIIGVPSSPTSIRNKEVNFKQSSSSSINIIIGYTYVFVGFHSHLCFFVSFSDHFVQQ